MAKRKQIVELGTSATIDTKQVLGEVWEFGMLVKVLDDQSWHMIPKGTVVKVVGKEEDGTIMLNYRGVPKWASPVELGTPYFA